MAELDRRIADAESDLEELREERASTESRLASLEESLEGSGGAGDAGRHVAVALRALAEPSQRPLDPAFAERARQRVEAMEELAVPGDAEAAGRGSRRPASASSRKRPETVAASAAVTSTRPGPRARAGAPRGMRGRRVASARRRPDATAWSSRYVVEVAPPWQGRTMALAGG